MEPETFKIVHLQKPAVEIDDDLWRLDVLIDIGDDKLHPFDLNIYGKPIVREVEKHFRTSINPLTDNDLKEISDKIIGEEYEAKYDSN